MYKQIDSNKQKTVILMLIFSVFVIVIGYFLSQYTELGYSAIVLAVILSLTMSLISYYQGDKVALTSTGAKPLNKEANLELYRLVENLCITAGLPTPKVYIIHDPAPNAFATGRDPQHASIALTTGLIEKLSRPEIEGVIAHELSHIKNYDIRLMMVVIVLVGIIAILSDIFVRATMFGGRKSDNKNSGGAMLIIGLVLMILSPFIAKIIQLAISRKREYLADADGALLTRYPDGLASALEKIANYKEPMQRTSAATAHLFISSPLSGKKSLSNLFATHPPINDRINKLRQMTA